MKPHVSVSALCLLLILPLLCSTHIVAGDANVDEAQRLIDGVINRKCGMGGIQQFIDTELTQNAGTGAEWYAFSLAQYSEYDFSSYEKSLIEYLSKNKFHSAASKQKYALCLASIGSTNEYISTVMNESVASSGIMAQIFRLHLLNNGYKDGCHTSDDICDILLSLQCNDGGWSIGSDTGDVDVTAMALQALSFCRKHSDSIIRACDKALEFLSNAQLDNGGYKSYGVENSESCSQVLVALSSLDIDCSVDLRFIKNGYTLFDALARFRLDDGSFCHIIGKGTNETATVQVLYSMIAYIRMADGKAPLYILDHARPSEVSTFLSATDTGAITDETSAGSVAKKNNVKLVICLITSCCGGAICVLLFMIKKNQPKNLIFVAIICVIAIVFVCLNDFYLPSDYYSTDADQANAPVGTVTLCISCHTVVGKSDSEYIPSDGILLIDTEFEFDEGETVYDILVRAARRHGIQTDIRGDGETAYVSGIGFLYEFDFGELSGWVYHVNGVSPSIGCGQYALSDGDKIEWLYTCELGNDVTALS